MAVRKSGRHEGLGYEVTGIALAGLAALVTASLYFRDDVEHLEYVGVAGSYLSWLLFVSMGYTSYIFPLLLFILALEFMLLRRGLRFRAVLPAGLLFIVMSASGLLTMTLPVEAAGGIVGEVVSAALTSYFGTAGAAILLVTVFVTALVGTTGFSLIKTAAATAVAALKGAAAAAAAAARTFRAARESLKRRRERRAKAAAEKSERRKRAKGPAIVTAKESPRRAAEEPVQEEFDFVAPKGSFRLPHINLLDPVPDKDGSVDRETYITNSKILEKKLKDFDVDGHVVEVHPGPVITMYEFEPAPGVKVGKITNLADDLALAMRAVSIRILAPIPGKAVVGIEIPNHVREGIFAREILGCREFAKSRSRLTMALGTDITGNPVITDLARLPHLLIAGATGSGKSVALNAMIISILFKATPEDVRLLMIDPKMLELTAYEGLPHLITPVITDTKRAAGVLKSIVVEMGKRYKLMAEKGAKNINMYNRILEEEEGTADSGPRAARDTEEQEQENAHRRLPYIVVIIDELADLMLTSGKDVEESLVRLTQMARAAGIHLIVATQRPSVDVITGLIKANFPARLALQVPTRTDSRTILDAAGAETLLGEGDMLFMPPGTSRLRRIHGVYVSEHEIEKVIDFLKRQGKPRYDADIAEAKAAAAAGGEEDLSEEFLRRYDEAVALAATLETISTSYIQRRLRIGYNTAARIIEKMEAEGVVGPSQGSRPREVLLRKEEVEP
ncbi:MAG TPA: DNA translocase FtsK [Deltaproteobacteria bacterium]|nr:DNA translocase FtsK [Deltaproteobacteria bacterium]